MNLRGAKPVVDNSIKDFICNLQPGQDLYKDDLPQEFIGNFVNWIKDSKLNRIDGLDDFTNVKLCAGTAQAFDHFYWRHQNRRFRFYDQEFVYHNVVLKKGGKFKLLDLSRLEKNDAVIISVPFSDTGMVHHELYNILEDANNLHLPVLLDFAYFPCSKNIIVDLNKYPCIETLAFSISKAFYGAEFLRVGVRLQKEDIDDGIDMFNSVDMVNRIGISIANSLIQRYSVDHNWNSYSKIYQTVCKEYSLQQTDCVMFGLGGEEYKHLNRGGSVNRVCISEIIGEKINGSSK